MQGTVSAFDPERKDGTVLLDDGTEVAFDMAAFEASGLRLLRPGQRLHLTRDAAHHIIRVSIGS